MIAYFQTELNQLDDFWFIEHYNTSDKVDLSLFLVYLSYLSRFLRKVAPGQLLVVLNLSIVIKQMRNFKYEIFSFWIRTPGNVGVSSKHVLICSNYRNSVWFSIAVTVERT